MLFSVRKQEIEKERLKLEIQKARWDVEDAREQERDKQAKVDKAIDREHSRWIVFLQRWENEVVAPERLGWDAQKTASEFGKLALSTAFLLNGGALVALPPFMQWLNANGRMLVPNVAVWFPLGIGAATISILIAYLNFMSAKAQQYAYARKRGIELDKLHINKNAIGDPKHTAALAAHRNAGMVVTATQIAATFFCIASYLFFMIGVWGFLTLAQYNTLPR